jgi:hypothetical protein
LPWTKRANDAGTFLCDQMCKTTVYSLPDIQTGRVNIFNAADDTPHKCPTAEIAKMFQTHYNMVRANEIDNILEHIQNSVIGLRNELDRQVQYNMNHKDDLKNWKANNRMKQRIRRQA